MSDEDLKALREEQNKKMLQSVIIVRHEELKSNLKDLNSVKSRVTLHQNSRSAAIVIRYIEDAEIRLVTEFSSFIESNQHAKKEYNDLVSCEKIIPISPIRV